MLSHMALIKGISIKMGNGSRFNLDDFIQECIIRVFNACGAYDPKKGAPSSFIWNHVRAAKKEALRKNRKKSLEVTDGTDPLSRGGIRDHVLISHSVAGDRSTAAECAARISEIRNSVSAEDWMVIVACAEGFTGDELAAKTGMSRFGAQRKRQRALEPFL